MWLTRDHRSKEFAIPRWHSIGGGSGRSGKIVPWVIASELNQPNQQSSA